LRTEEIELLRRTVAKGCSEDEFALFLWVCRKHKLDPLTRQIYAVKRHLKKHHQETRQGQDGGTFQVWVEGDQMTIQMGIDGYRSLAGRDHKDYGGCDDALYVWFEDKRQTPAGKLIPEKATIRFWKKGLEHPVIASAYWEEYAPANVEDGAGFWNRMPKHMLGKCAEALAIRKGFPELSDIYTDVEFAQADQDYTKDGRLLVESDGRAPSGAPTGAYGVNTWRAQQGAIDSALEAQEKEKAVADLKKRGLWCEEHQCPISTNHLKECESSRKKSSPATGNADRIGSQEQPGASTSEPAQGQPTAGTSTSSHTPTPTPKAGAAGPAGGGAPGSPSPAGFLGKIEVDWTDKASPIVRGDLTGAILDSFKKHCNPTWGKDDWWHIAPTATQTLKEMCAAYNYEFVEVFPAEKLPPNTQRGTDKLPPSKKKPAKPPVEPTLVKGTLERVSSGMTQKNSPTRQVKIGGFWFTSYVNPIFDSLDRGLGKDSELWVDERKNIVGIKRIGSRMFDADGRTPIVDRDEPRGGNLFEK